MSGNDFSGYFGRSFGRLRAVNGQSPHDGCGLITSTRKPAARAIVTTGPNRFQPARTSGGPSTDAAIEKTGTVKWFNTQRGYGFVTPDGGNKDVFVHVSALERSGLTGLSDEDRVIVDVTEGRKGLEAARVRLL